VPEARSGDTLLLEADLSDREGTEAALAAIRAKLGRRRLMVLAGGPPCQGFSHAGWRAPTDGRNDLASTFMWFVRELQPELVLLENVEGLLTYDKGRVVQDLLMTLSELGYAVPEPWSLRAEAFGVPQMRRRVFIVGSSRNEIPSPPREISRACKGRREAVDELDLPGSLPYPVTVAEALGGLRPLGLTSHPGVGRRPVRSAYQRWVRDEIPIGALADELLRQSHTSGS
jgi:site-specific DNA-cytosine methylase